ELVDSGRGDVVAGQGLDGSEIHDVDGAGTGVPNLGGMVHHVEIGVSGDGDVLLVSGSVGGSLAVGTGHGDDGLVSAHALVVDDDALHTLQAVNDAAQSALGSDAVENLVVVAEDVVAQSGAVH